jgi:hypothetical protein
MRGHRALDLRKDGAREAFVADKHDRNERVGARF